MQLACEKWWHIPVDKTFTDLTILKIIQYSFYEVENTVLAYTSGERSLLVMEIEPTPLNYANY